jgi:hypothetical protein
MGLLSCLVSADGCLNYRREMAANDRVWGASDERELGV